MGNTATTTAKTQTLTLVPQPSFHSIGREDVIQSSIKITHKDIKKKKLAPFTSTVSKAISSSSEHDMKADSNEIPATKLEMKPTTMSHDSHKTQYNQNLDKAIAVTPNTNIIGHISNIFIYHRRLAKGSSCCVLLCQDKKTNELYALKEMNKNSIWNPLLYITEIKILNILKSHQHIVTYYDSYIDNKCLYIATAYCGGGTLLDKIIKLHKFTEKIAAKYITTILSVVQFIHRHQIAHRDLKPNNIVFDKKGDDGVLKLIDFGDAIIIEDNEENGNFVGTLHYFTPEMIKNPKRKGWEMRKGDTYCIGVIAYVLLTGCYPFHSTSDDKEETKQLILGGNIIWPTHVKLSDNCKDFILSLLNQNVAQRLDTKQALSHKWLTGDASNDDLGDNLKIAQKNFKHANILQHLLIEAIFTEMTKDEKVLIVDELQKYKDKRQKDKNKNKNKKYDKHKIDYIALAKTRRNSLISEQEFVEFMIANHVDSNRAKTESEKIFKQVSIRQNSKRCKMGNRSHTELDDLDVEMLLQDLIKENDLESTMSITDEFGFGETEHDLFYEETMENQPQDILISLSPNKTDNKFKMKGHEKNKNDKNDKKQRTNNKGKNSSKSMHNIDLKKLKEDIPNLNIHHLVRSQSLKSQTPSISIKNDNLKLEIDISLTTNISIDSLEKKTSKSIKRKDSLSMDDDDHIDLSDIEYDDMDFGRTESIYKTSVPMMQTSPSITVDQFRNLLSKAPQKFDIQSVIDDLDPKNTGIIDLRTITNYSREIEYMD